MDEFTGQGAPLSEEGLADALDVTQSEAEALWAVLHVETSGCGFLQDRRPKILFERHYFHTLTQGRFDAVAPDISDPTAGGYGPGGAPQYDRLAAAIQLDRAAALQSASWGLGQIMGANFAAAGFDDVETMVASFVGSEDGQLKGMAAFIAGSPLKAALSGRNWATFARLYNGPDYAANHYDDSLAAAYARFKSQGAPNLDVRQAQVWLSYLGNDTGGIDGVAGGKTTAAIQAFQRSKGIAPADGQTSSETLEALAQA